jgi:glycosyltransferase involved in cell wall biosynthesis
VKILHVIPFFSEKFGGSVVSVYRDSKEFALRGHEITIITTQYGFNEEYANKLRQFGVQILAFPYLFCVASFIFSPKMKKWLSCEIGKYDIVHLNNFRSYQNFITMKFALKENIPYILQAHGDVPYVYKKSLKRLFDIFLGNKILINATRCIALIQTESDQYIKVGVPKNKIIIIPNGIDISQYEDLPPRGNFRSKYQIPESERIILSLGRIHEIKGIDLLVEAFSQICCQINNVKLVIAGPDGGFLSQIKQQVCELHLENYVIFIGPLYGKDKTEAYVDADVFVMPSRYEIFGNTVLEAWACRTPVIVTKGCLISDIVENAGYVTAFDSKELKEVILRTFTDDKGRIKNVNSGLTLIQNEFNSITIIDRLENLYGEMISR